MKKVITCSTCDTRSATEESLSAFEKIIINTSDLLVSPESKLLLQRNKWVIAHPEREPLIKQGAYPGLLGENKELHY